MESLVDLVTTSFQAVAAVAVVFTAGYAINTRQDAKLASVSNNSLPPPGIVNNTEHIGRGSEPTPACSAVHHTCFNSNDMANFAHA
jgi:hypothetical protein